MHNNGTQNESHTDFDQIVVDEAGVFFSIIVGTNVSRSKLNEQFLGISYRQLFHA